MKRAASIHFSHQRPRGIAIGVVIATLMLLALLAASIAISSHDTTSYVAREQYKTMIMTQAQMIRQKFMKCALDYPLASNGDANAYDPALPATPANMHANIATCPGTGANVFDGTDGAFFPNNNLCGNWFYINDKTKAIPYPNLQITCSSIEGIAALTDLYNVFNVGEGQQSTNYKTNDTLIWYLHK